MMNFKSALKNRIERSVDCILDYGVPYRLLAKTKLRTCRVPAGVPLHYVVNQKIQRLQIIDMLNQMGIARPKRIKAWWSRGLDNFGDELLAYLLARLAGIECVFTHNKAFIAIGSIVRFATDRSIVWGSGIIRADETITGKPKCLAVRGPLTRDKLLSYHVPCPAVYGDPAMLFPLIYTPKRRPADKAALIVPHFKHTDLIPLYPDFDYRPLHLTSLYDIEPIIDDIASARCVVTSSLHAFIFCVAYGVPVAVFKLDSKGIGGDNIKFDDFCAGVGLEPLTIHALEQADQGSLSHLVEAAKLYTPDWSPKPLLQSLMEAYSTDTLQGRLDQLS